MQSFPFDSKLTYDEHDNPIYDRAVSSQPLRKLIKELFTTGVMPNPSTNLQVSAGSDGMTVQIAAGFAVIDGGLCRETETRTLEVTAADNTYDRIDTVVLRWNENVDVRNADLYVIAGTPAVNPVRPTLQRNNSIYEIGLADVFITKRVATITNDKITDTRYEAERCGIVSSISKFDTTTLYQQIQADLAGFKSTEQANFLTWYESIKNILDKNAAGHLQNEIDAIRPRVTTNLLNPTLDTTTINGITCTANGDGTYTLNGTTTADARIQVELGDTIDSIIPNGKLVRLIGCPEGGTRQTYFLYTQNINYNDFGDGVNFNWDTKIGSVAIFVNHGVTVTDLVFKPMITTDLTATYDDYVQYSGDGELNENVAKHEKDITQLNTNLTASDNLKFQFTKSGNDYGYKDSNGNFHPFNRVQASKTVTASTSTQTVTPDSGYHGIASVTVNPTPSQSKSITATTSTQTVNPDNGKLLSSVTVNPQVHSGTRTSVTSNGTIDLGETHNIRYVPVSVTSGMVNQATEVYQGTLDDNGSGQNITYSFTASTAGLYCMVALVYGGNTTSAVGTLGGITTTGTMIAQKQTYNTSSNRYCTMHIGFAKLAYGQSMSVTIPTPNASGWPVRTAKAWLIGNY